MYELIFALVLAVSIAHVIFVAYRYTFIRQEDFEKRIYLRVWVYLFCLYLRIVLGVHAIWKLNFQELLLSTFLDTVVDSVCWGNSTRRVAAIHNRNNIFYRTSYVYAFNIFFTISEFLKFEIFKLIASNLQILSLYEDLVPLRALVIAFIDATPMKITLNFFLIIISLLDSIYIGDLYDCTEKLKVMLKLMSARDGKTYYLSTDKIGIPVGVSRRGLSKHIFIMGLENLRRSTSVDKIKNDVYMKYMNSASRDEIDAFELNMMTDYRWFDQYWESYFDCTFGNEYAVEGDFWFDVPFDVDEDLQKKLLARLDDEGMIIKNVSDYKGIEHNYIVLNCKSAYKITKEAPKYTNTTINYVNLTDRNVFEDHFSCGLFELNLSIFKLFKSFFSHLIDPLISNKLNQKIESDGFYIFDSVLLPHGVHHDR